MSTAPTPVARRSHVPLFFALSLFAWILWAPQAAHRLGASVSYAPLQSPVNVLTVWSPGLAALLLVARESGRAGVGALGGSGTSPRGSPGAPASPRGSRS